MTRKRSRSKADAADAIDAAPAAPAVGPGRIDLGASCTLHEVAALRATCLAALDGPATPVLDGARVEHVDTAGLQVLVGFTIDCMERSRDFAWSGRSATLVRAIRTLGLEALLESPGLAASPAGAGA